MGSLKRAEQGAAAVMLLLALGVVWFTRNLGFWAGITPGARFVPLLVAGAATVLAVLLFVQAARSDGEEQVDWPRGAGLARVCGMVAAILIFALAGGMTGFVAASFLFVLGTLLLVLRRPLLPSLLSATITTALIWGLFIGWLGVRLPVGPFGV